MTKLERLFSAAPDGLVMNIQKLYGSLLKATARDPVGCHVVKVLHTGLGKFLGAAAKAGDLDEGRGAVAISRQAMAKFFSPIMTVEEESETQWIFAFSRCPYGLAGNEDRELCHAVMRFEEELVLSLGGQLTILERIPEGAARCRFLVQNR